MDHKTSLDRLFTKFPSMLVTFGLLSLTLFAPPTSLAAVADLQGPAQEVTTVSVIPAAMTFEVPDSYDLLALTVTGPDGSFSEGRAEYASRLDFDLLDEKGVSRADGTYSYELKGLASHGEEVRLLGSGHFSIREGVFVTPEAREKELFKAEQTPDDLIVAGSVCAGEECTTTETFGTETFKGKEDNVRILFEDTSDTGSFPTRDWMLMANERKNGGADLFSIVDCGNNSAGCSTDDSGTVPFTIRGGAPANALYLDADGDLGLGTQAPAMDIHVVNGNSPALRLDQDGSDGFAAQTWDLSGNEVNFFLRDSNRNRLPFRVRVGAPNNSIYVSENGDTALGKASASEKLDVVGNIAVTGTVDGRDLAADGAALDSHIADRNNPHGVTAAQIGAIDQAALDAHTGDTSNPHQVTAAQVGADPVGAAAAALAAHEATFNHATLPSALPVPLTEGGTGATDLATARANLGIEHDPTRTGIVYPGSFSGSPSTATVTFATPFDLGTNYVVLLTAFGSDAGQPIGANLVSKNEAGFTVALSGAPATLVELNWLARPVTEPEAPGGIGCLIGNPDVWADGYVLNDVTVTNQGSQSIESWSVTLQFAEPTSLTNSWNGQFNLSPEGTTLIVTNTTNNGILAAGQTTTFGFQGTHDGSFDPPTCSGD